MRTLPGWCTSEKPFRIVFFLIVQKCFLQKNKNESNDADNKSKSKGNLDMAMAMEKGQW